MGLIVVKNFSLLGQYKRPRLRPVLSGRLTQIDVSVNIFFWEIGVPFAALIWSWEFIVYKFKMLLVHTGSLEALCFGPAVTSMLCWWPLKVIISMALGSHVMALNASTRVCSSLTELVLMCSLGEELFIPPVQIQAG